MKRILILLLALTFACGTAMAANLHNHTWGMTPVPFDSSSSPDEYGYSWYDNDGGGTVPYEWFEISGIGVEITDGLGDDNNVGPIPIGFDFPYYWYEVNRMWIGSNGYISFSSNANYAHPFSDLPYPGQPNDLVCPLTGDLDPSRGDPHCYYWTNNVDSFVVQWEDFGEFNFIDSTHTFQLVLDATDSSLTVYYGEQNGNFLDSNGENKNIIGIEDITGGIGHSYLRDNAPVSHLYHDGLALRFHPEPDPNFVLHDVGPRSLFNDDNQANIVPINQMTPIEVQVSNYGTEVENNFDVVLTVKDAGNSTVYQDTVTITDPIPASSSIWVEFPGFTPTQENQYRCDARTYLGGDEVPLNNSKRAELRVISIQQDVPVDLLYDDNTAENGLAWNGDFSGFGNEFDFPALPVNVNTASVNINSVALAGNLHVWLMDDDGTGNPGDILAADTVRIAVDDTGFVEIDFSGDNIYIEDGKIFAVGIAETQGTFYFGLDESATLPFSYRGWEYTGGLAPDRHRETSDIMIRVNVTPTDVVIPCCDVDMIPDDDPVIVEPGGRFGLTGIIANPSPDPITTDVWGGVKYQGYYFNQFGFNNIPLNPGQFLSAHTWQNVPGFAPQGTYDYVAYCGDRPSEKCDSASFPFTVVGARLADGASEWSIEGAFFGDEVIPEQVSLIGCHPNPFNASATITFQLPVAGNVNLEVYNLMGQRVATLVNGKQKAGVHNVVWDAANFSSGVYFYKLSAGGEVFTKRMTLLK